MKTHSYVHSARSGVSTVGVDQLTLQKLFYEPLQKLDDFLQKVY